MKKSPRYLYTNDISNFTTADKNAVLGELCSNYHGDALTTTRDAWIAEIDILQRVLSSETFHSGKIVFEYDIPRLGKRIDVVLLINNIIICLEFKVGEKNILQADIEQVLDYALDLKNFHLFSHDKTIVPILVATEHKKSSSVLQSSIYDDAIVNPLTTGNNGLYNILEKTVTKYGNPSSDESLDNWVISPYSPTPTIIEAARALYENHSVENITRHEADNISTDTTTNYILKVINDSKLHNKKSICFVTGVPGAGKTLVGLDVAVKQSYKDDNNDTLNDEGAVYLSGNGPLVAVLTEALALNNYNKCRERGIKKKLTDSRREVSKFIQIIHRYRDNMLAKIKNPVNNGQLEIDPDKAIKNHKAGYGEVEHVAIFDEAQRSWTHERLANYLKRGGTYGNKLKVSNFPVSEAAFLIWSLDQREDWATIVCLVGGGQEINTGEAGIAEWISALNEKFQKWEIHISGKLTDPEYAEGKVKELLNNNPNVTYSDDLHLSVSIRSFRAEKLSAFVHALLSISPNANEILSEFQDRYPIVLTRNMDTARRWLRDKARGTERTGVLVTKEAARFKPQAVHLLPANDDNTVHWFLADIQDSRSSNYLEDAATEIQVQGLELDYACLLWDADMRYEDGKWHFYSFNGKKDWIEQKGITPTKQDKIKYMLNAYRVLLTRARKGLVICVPEGNANKSYDNVGNEFWEDPTRLPAFYDSTYLYLKSLGLQEI